MATIQVKVKPGARASTFECLADGTYLAQVKSPPVDGKANAELIASAPALLEANAALVQAQAVLSAPQVSALKELQRQQLAQQQVQQIVRESLSSANRPAAAPAPTPRR